MSDGIIKLLKQSAQVTGLLGGLNAGRVAHAYMLVGPAGSGKGELASLCAKMLLCDGEGADFPCEVCAGCKLSCSEAHPDDIVIGTEKISVDDVRELLSRIAAKPFADARRVVRLLHAGGMTPQAQNALLKTLEEPPPSTVFFLLTRDEANLLRTIRSRCRAVYLPRFSDDVLTAWLAAQGLAGEGTTRAVARAGGLPGLAAKLAAQPKDEAALWAEKFVRADDARRVSLIMEAADRRDDADDFLDALEACLREDLRIALESNANAEGFNRLSRILMLAENCAKARMRLRSFVSWPSVLHELL